VSADRPDAEFLDALDASTADLSEEEITLYQSLACFPQETVIPIATVGRLWGCGEPGLGAQLRRFAELGGF